MALKSPDLLRSLCGVVLLRIALLVTSDLMIAGEECMYVLVSKKSESSESVDVNDSKQ